MLVTRYEAGQIAREINNYISQQSFTRQQDIYDIVSKHTGYTCEAPHYTYDPDEPEQETNDKPTEIVLTVLGDEEVGIIPRYACVYCFKCRGAIDYAENYYMHIYE
jgi:hypothetical protein